MLRFKIYGAILRRQYGLFYSLAKVRQQSLLDVIKSLFIKIGEIAMKNNQKLFAFKLAEQVQKDKTSKVTPWKARDGVSVAGCTDYLWPGNLRYSAGFGSDNGVFC